MRQQKQLKTSGKSTDDERILSTSEAIKEKMEKIISKHDNVNESIKAMRSQGSRLINGTRLSQVAKGKMVALYTSALKQCQSEQSSLEQILTDIQLRRQLYFRQRMADKLSRGSLMMLLAQHANSLPMYVGRIDEHPPPGVGAIARKGKLLKGDLVAAYVEDVWILAEIINNHISETKYEIRDIDDETERKLVLSVDHLISLPQYRADSRRHGHALFPKNAIVLALYPQTTCFYKGVIEHTPTTPTEDYLIAFEDITFSSGYSPTLPVPQMFVVTFRDSPQLGRKK